MRTPALKRILSVLILLTGLAAIETVPSCKDAVNNWVYYKTEVTAYVTHEDSLRAAAFGLALDRAAYAALGTQPYALQFDRKSTDEAVRSACDDYAGSVGDTLRGQFTVNMKKFLSSADLTRQPTRLIWSYHNDRPAGTLRPELISTRKR